MADQSNRNQGSDIGVNKNMPGQNNRGNQQQQQNPSRSAGVNDENQKSRTSTNNYQDAKKSDM